MRKYFYCEANFAVYTEKEKLNSVFSSGRFVLIGEYKNRSQAEWAMRDKDYNVVTSIKKR